MFFLIWQTYFNRKLTSDWPIGHLWNCQDCSLVDRDWLKSSKVNPVNKENPELKKRKGELTSQWLKNWLANQMLVENVENWGMDHSSKWNLNKAYQKPKPGKTYES